MQSLVKIFFLFLFMVWTPYVLSAEEPITIEPKTESISPKKEPEQTAMPTKPIATITSKQSYAPKIPVEGTKAHEEYQERLSRFQQMRESLLKKKGSVYKIPQRRPQLPIQKGPQPVRKKATPGHEAKVVRYISPQAPHDAPTEKKPTETLTPTQIALQRRKAFEKQQKDLKRKSKKAKKKTKKKRSDKTQTTIVE